MKKLWLPPKVWLHGSQSTTTGGSSSSSGQFSAMACWLAQIIRWVLATPLGTPVEPEVKRTLASVSGDSPAKAASTAGPGAQAAASSTVTTRRPASAACPLDTSHGVAGASTAAARAKATPSAA